jgi:hypothetical protein
MVDEDEENGIGRVDAPLRVSETRQGAHSEGVQ